MTNDFYSVQTCKSVLFISFFVFCIVSCSNDNMLEPQIDEPEISEKAILKIGLVADPHYVEGQPDSNTRYYSKVLNHLDTAIDTFNTNGVTVVQSLGDIIDRSWESFDVVLPLYERLDSRVESYQLLGNHEYYIDSLYTSELLSRLNMPDYYYSYTRGSWRFIVLNSTDHAFYSDNFKSIEHRLKTQEYFDEIDGDANAQTYNGAIGIIQQNWLKNELDLAALNNQKAIIYAHMPLKPLGGKANLWNNLEIIEILEDYEDEIFAYINGHSNVGTKVSEGIHYITLSSMIAVENNAFAILEIYDDRVEFVGFGDQESHSFPLEK